MIGRCLAGALAAATVAAAGCGRLGSTDFVPEELELNRARWVELGLLDYAYDLHVLCQCGPSVTEPARVEVRAGVVTSVAYISNSEQVQGEARAAFLTVDALFEKIADALEVNAASIFARYDPDRAYPVEVALDYALGSSDDNVSYAASNLAALDSATAPLAAVTRVRGSRSR